MSRKITRRARQRIHDLTAPRGAIAAPDHFGPEFERARAACTPFTMTSTARMFALWQAIRYVVRARVPGDVVECGVWRGGSAMVVAHALADVGADRPIWLYDTFEGMPPPGSRDVRTADGRSAAGVVAAQAPGWDVALPEDVEARVRAAGAGEVHVVRGLVEETVPREAPERIALLRLDTDWYGSTRHELERLWPRLSPGGVLLLDDYGYWQGAREAVDEYFAAAGVALLLHRIDADGRIAVKPHMVTP